MNPKIKLIGIYPIGLDFYNYFMKDKLIKSGIDLEKIDQTHNTIREEALSGLLILGFNKSSAEKAIDKVLKADEVVDVEGLIKEVLKML